MLKIISLAVIGCLVSIIIRQYCKEFLLLFQIGFGLVFIFMLLEGTADKINDYFEIFTAFSQSSDIITAMLRAAAVSLCVKLGCDVCKESHNILLEGIIETGGRLMIFAIAFPYILKIFEIATDYLQ